MERREFLRLLGWGLAATWSGARLSAPRAALAGPGTGLRLALLADAHLVDGREGRPEAVHLARAVAEIRGLKPAPDLVCFAGDLAHGADPRALALGREILSDLPAPFFPLLGEGDGLPEDAAAWRHHFGEPWFAAAVSGKGPEQPPLGPPRHLPRLQVLGLHAAWCPGPAGGGFYVGESGRRWVARQLALLDPGQPLILLSHAPLARLFHPWQQWTGDAPELVRLFSQFSRVCAVHGHVHNSGTRGQGSEVRGGPNLDSYPAKLNSEITNPILHQGLPATAWPRPDARQGTPAALRPGLGPRGCGWAEILLTGEALQFTPHLWPA
jgi:Icc protein